MHGVSSLAARVVAGETEVTKESLVTLTGELNGAVFYTLNASSMVLKQAQ